MSSELDSVGKISDREILELTWRMKGSSKAEPRRKESELAQIPPDECLAGRKVLIVDDDEDSLLVAQYIVESLGCTVIPVVSGHSVVSSALSCRPDVILLDIRLDGISGVDVFQRLQQHRQLARIPVVAVTALAQPAERASVMAAGFADFLLKPYLANELCQVISAYLPKSFKSKSFKPDGY